MSSKEFHYRWEWLLHATPETLWPLVSNTNRFDRDAKHPPVEKQPSSGLTQRVRLRIFGISIEWDEEPFEWIRPYRYGVVRRYLDGPMAELRVAVELVPQADGKTQLIYQIWAKPGNPIGLLLIPFQIGFVCKREFGAMFKKYEKIVNHVIPPLHSSFRIQLAPGASQRIEKIREELKSKKISGHLITPLVEIIEKEDDLGILHLRPYAFADSRDIKRREALELFLHATRAGLLEFRWDLLCPLCRGAKQSESSLEKINSKTHCDSCNIDYSANFDRSVELTFRPSPSIRPVEAYEYCVGNPQITPHIVIQQNLSPGETRELTLSLGNGIYRIRTQEFNKGALVKISKDGLSKAAFCTSKDGLEQNEWHLKPNAAVLLKNDTRQKQRFILEETTWSDQIVTAAEVTELQTFRDLFASEALRPGEQISVGTITILFTDLQQSTQLYREIGDAPAFGHVMNHFDVLKEVINAENGAIVKTIGDSVMAVFRRPIFALRATLKASQLLASNSTNQRPLVLKAGIHCGSCIAVNLNQRMDYFGSTINLAARLESFSSQGNIVISDDLRKDPEINDFLNASQNKIQAQPSETTLKGFDTERFKLWHIKQNVA